MFTKEERLFIWKKVYEMIDRLEDGEYIAEYCERYYKRIRIVFLLIYFIHQIKFWVLACRFVRIGMPISVS